MIKNTLFLLLFICFSTINVHAKNVKAHSNTKTIGIASGPIGGTYARFAQDLALATYNNPDFRILPMVSSGSVQNIADLIWLNGIDIAIVQSDVLKATKEIKLTNDVTDKIVYVSKLYNEEIHILLHKNINSLKQLDGKKVSVGSVGSGTSMTAGILFESMGIDIKKYYLSNEVAIKKLSTQEIDAAVFLAGKPFAFLQTLPTSNNYQLATIKLDDKLASMGYVHATITPEDYPNLITNQTIETIAVPAVLAAYNWNKDTNRYKRIVQFSQSLQQLLPILKNSQGYHPKWKKVSLDDSINGWKRFQ